MGILNLLKGEGIKLALFTGKGRRTTQITLSELGLERYFDIIITGDDVENHKPSGDGILKILERLNLRPDEVIFIGDSPSDLKAGREAGVRIISALWDSYGRDEVIRMCPDYVANSVDELRRILFSIIQDVKESLIKG
jgi:phosphoglycolate phosphatase-like HAD superfamily hydrolase